MSRESVSCDLCGETSEKELFHGYDKMFLWRQERFRVVQCRTCGLVYLNPRPTPAAKHKYYSQDYPFYQTDEKKQQTLLHYQPVINWIDQRVGKGSVLDVGTGGSIFLPTMLERGYEVVGTEVDPQIVQYMRDGLGLTVLQGCLEDLDLPPERFDAVTIMGVLEHIPSPRRLLTEVNRVLKPNGVLALFCFHRGLEARFLGKHWLGFDVPRHSYSFSSESLRALLDRAGFAVDQAIYPAYTFLPFSAQLGLARLAQRVGDAQGLLSVGHLPTPLSFMLRLVGVPLALAKESSKCYFFASKTADGRVAREQSLNE